ncbi:hypothetical protein [Acrocarpospora sp. B8E8]|uniref:hypothetical protein n=1 Tax=Acrocarpospora sp. B8E8 TaxID=3153572 RepID=UPI00325F9347
MNKAGPGTLSEHPFELLFGLIAILGGAAAALGVVSPTSINALLPLLVVRAWGVLQLAAGVSVVAGIVLSARADRLVLGWRLERAGLWPLAATLIIYAGVALAHSGMRALYPASFYLVFAAACVARARALARLEETIRKHMGSADG